MSELTGGPDGTMRREAGGRRPDTALWITSIATKEGS